MKKRQLTSIFYFAYICSLAVVIIFVFIIMDRLETSTSLIEQKIIQRNITNIIDQNYKLDLVTVKTEEDEFLNEITSFFFNYHKNSKDFRYKMTRFRRHRSLIIERFRMSSITYFDLSIEPNPAYPDFYLDFDLFPKSTIINVPFTKNVVFTSREIKTKHIHSYFLCTGRIAMSSNSNSLVEVQITEANESIEEHSFMKYQLNANEDYIVNLNRLLYIKTVRPIRIGVQISSEESVKITRSEVRCILFDDVK